MIEKSLKNEQLRKPKIAADVERDDGLSDLVGSSEANRKKSRIYDPNAPDKYI